MEYNNEKGLCTRHSKSIKFNLKWVIIGALCWIPFSFLINVIVALCADGDISEMFDGGLYWIGFGNMILGAVVALVCWLLTLLPDEEREYVLTDKRLYVNIHRKTLFSGVITYNYSYMLNKVVTHTLMYRQKINNYILAFKTPTDNLTGFVVDQEMYEIFVSAVNNNH